MAESGHTGRAILEESVRYDTLRCAECGWSEDIEEGTTIRQAREIFEEHFENDCSIDGGEKNAE